MPPLEAAQSLLGYLKIRNWSADIIRNISHGSDLQYIEVMTTLYISYAFSAIDLVYDEIQDKREKSNYYNMIDNLAGKEFMNFARELRNSIVHRGQSPAPDATSDGAFLSLNLPDAISNRVGNLVFERPCRKWTELVSALNSASSAVILPVIEKYEWIPEHADPNQGAQMRQQYISVDLPFPDKAARLLKQAAPAEIDFDEVAEKIVSTRRNQIIQQLNFY